MTFQQVFCNAEVEIIVYKTDGDQYRMDIGEVVVVTMATGEEVVCGTLHIRDATSGPHQGKVYSVECGGYACGDQVRLGVQQSAGDNERMITMREITAFYSVGVSR